MPHAAGRRPAREAPPPGDGTDGGGDSSRALRRRRARRASLLGAVAVLLSVTALVSAGPIAASLVESRARSRGIELHVRRASLGWGSIRLNDLSARVPEIPGAEIVLDRVEVFPTVLLAPKRVEVHGGTVRVDGSYEELGDRVEAFRTAHRVVGEGRPDAAGAALLPVVVDGIDLSWSRLRAARDALHVWGARYERDADGREVLGADLARVVVASASSEVRRARAVVRRERDHRALVSADAEGSSTAIDLDALLGGSLDPGAERAPLAAAALRGSVPDPRHDAASTGRGRKVRQKIGEAATKIAAFLPSPSRVELPGARFEVRRAGETLNFGPATIAVARDAERVRVSVTSGAAPGRSPLELDVAAPTGEGPVEVALAGGPLPLAALGVREGDMGLEDVERAEFEVAGRARLDADGRAVSLSGHARVSDLSVREPKLAPDPVRGLRLTLGGDVKVALDGSEMTLTSVEVGLGKIKAVTRGSLSRQDGDAKVDLHVEVPLAACSDMLAGTPPALIPLLAGLDVAGTFALTGDLSLDTRKPSDVRVDFTVANGCRITKVPDALSPERFRRPWTRAVLGADKQPTTIESGPGTASWVPLFDVSPYVATGVVVCEDAHFYTHDGFDGKSLEDSIKDDLRVGRFVRGGSTVSMQLAKNLYLGREKTLSRKLEEAVLTLLLEQRLGKDGILELYLNVVELGPGIYGIGPAAAYYFHTTPKELSLAQALYLVSLLPNPRVHHFQEGGTLQPKWADYLRHLMGIAHKIHRISDQELEAGLAETVQFGAPAGAGSGARPEAGEPGGAEGSASPEVLDMAPQDEHTEAQGP